MVPRPHKVYRVLKLKTRTNAGWWWCTPEAEAGSLSSRPTSTTERVPEHPGNPVLETKQKQNIKALEKKKITKTMKEPYILKVLLLRLVS